MRATVVVLTLLCLAAPTAHAADYVVRPIDPAATPPATSTTEATPALAEKVDSPSSILVVPYYEVDTTSPIGNTTLFAVHNLKSGILEINVYYISRTGALHKETLGIAGKATYTRNVRDVAGLPVDSDGFARGFIRVVASEPLGAKVMTGDFFQVDNANNFATGDRMIQGADLCTHGEIRLVSFGTGTDLRLFINFPQGGNPSVDLPSASLLIYDEAGVLRSGVNFFTTSHTLFIHTDDLGLPINFGLIELSFDHSGGGYAYATYNAEGRFSVGMNSACLD